HLVCFINAVYMLCCYFIAIQTYLYNLFLSDRKRLDLILLIGKTVGDRIILLSILIVGKRRGATFNFY
ncbi:hypothetical protein ACJX0J_009078, partial [Zea mays]